MNKNILIMTSSQVQNSLNNGFHYVDTRRSSSNKEVVWLPPMESMNWLMHLHYTRGETERARGLIYDELQKSNGRNEYAHYLLGKILCDEEKLNEAIEEFRSCNKLSPANIDYIKQIAKCLYKQKRFKLALEALMEAENLATKLDWEIHYWIAECLSALGTNDAALQWSHRAARAGARLPACKQLGDLLSKSGDIPGAIQAYTAALENAPDNSELLTSLGILHVRAGQQQLAVERLGSALALGPPQTRALLPLAAIMQSHRDYDVALSRYKIAAQQSSDSAALWNNIGMCFYGKQKYVAAISCLKRAAALSPLSARVQHNLGLVHVTCAQHASAFQFLCSALNLRSGNAVTYMLMAITLDRLDDQDNATKAFEQAKSLAPEDLVIKINYIMFLLSYNKIDEARAHMTEAEDVTIKLQIVDKDIADHLLRLKAYLAVENVADDDKTGSVGSDATTRRLNSVPSYESITDPPALDVEETASGEHFVDPDEV